MKLSNLFSILKKTFIPSYRRRVLAEEAVANFISAECAYDNGARTKFRDAYEAYLKWYSENVSGQPLKKNRFSELMETRFRREVRGGNIWFSGLRLKTLPGEEAFRDLIEKDAQTNGPLSARLTVSQLPR